MLDGSLRAKRFAVALLAVLCALRGMAFAGDDCPSDLNNDRRVNDADLAQLMGSWASGHPGGAPSNAMVTLAQLIGDWGPCPNASARPMQLGIATGGIGAYLRDGRPFADRLLSCEIHALGIPTTPVGWPVPTGDQAAYFLTDSGDCPTPSGTYSLRYNGTGQVMASDRGARGPHPAKVLLEDGDLLVVQPDHSQGVQIVVRHSDPSDPVRDLSFTAIGVAPSSSSAAWVAPLQGWCGVIRFLGWTRLESDVSPDAYVSFTAADVPTLGSRASMNGDADPALAVQLAADAGADAWVCVIDGADESYYRAYARAMASKAVPRQRLIVEYSNEAAWNFQFAQFHRINRRGLLAGLPGARAQYAREALACFRIMREELGEQFVGVIGCQLANESVVNDILTEAERASDFRELVTAIAPSWYWYPTLTPGSAGGQTVSVSALVANCAHEINVTMRNRLVRHKEIADLHDLELWTYEGGPHPPGQLTGHPFYHPYMASVEISENYRLATEVCRESGVQVLTHMGYCADPTIATWYLGPDPSTVRLAPRYKAFRAAATINNQDDGAH